MISFQQIQYILALYDFGQFQKASEACHVTQPTLSMQVKKAEDTLGHKLFNRAASPLKLTPFGEKMIPVLRDLMIENSRIEQLVNKENGTSTEKINVGIIPTIASYLVPELFKDLVNNCNGTVYSFKEHHTMQLIEELAQGRLDMIILAGPFQRQGLLSVKLFDEEIKAYVQGKVASEITSNSLKELKPWLLTEGNCLRTQMVSFCGIGTDGSGESWDYEGGNLDLLMKMVDTHGGYTLVPEHCLTQPSSRGKSVSIRIEENGHFPARTVIAVYPSRSVFRSGIEKMIRTIQYTYARSQDKILESIGWQGD